jgi:hypothetical protein
MDNDMYFMLEDMMHENRIEMGINLKCVIGIAYHVHQVLQLD